MRGGRARSEVLAWIAEPGSAVAQSEADEEQHPRQNSEDKDGTTPQVVCPGGSLDQRHIGPTKPKVISAGRVVPRWRDAEAGDKHATRRTKEEQSRAHRITVFQVFHLDRHR